MVYIKYCITLARYRAIRDAGRCMLDFKGVFCLVQHPVWTRISVFVFTPSAE
jgi:hypothetical protein